MSSEFYESLCPYHRATQPQSRCLFSAGTPPPYTHPTAPELTPDDLNALSQAIDFPCSDPISSAVITPSSKRDDIIIQEYSPSTPVQIAQIQNQLALYDAVLAINKRHLPNHVFEPKYWAAESSASFIHMNYTRMPFLYTPHQCDTASSPTATIHVNSTSHADRHSTTLRQVPVLTIDDLRRQVLALITYKYDLEHYEANLNKYMNDHSITSKDLKARHASAIPPPVAPLVCPHLLPIEIHYYQSAHCLCRQIDCAFCFGWASSRHAYRYPEALANSHPYLKHHHNVGTKVTITNRKFIIPRACHETAPNCVVCYNVLFPRLAYPLYTLLQMSYIKYAHSGTLHRCGEYFQQYNNGLFNTMTPKNHKDGLNNNNSQVHDNCTVLSFGTMKDNKTTALKILFNDLDEIAILIQKYKRLNPFVIFATTPSEITKHPVKMTNNASTDQIIAEIFDHSKMYHLNDIPYHLSSVSDDPSDILPQIKQYLYYVSQPRSTLAKAQSVGHTLQRNQHLAPYPLSQLLFPFINHQLKNEHFKLFNQFIEFKQPDNEQSTPNAPTNRNRMINHGKFHPVALYNHLQHTLSTIPTINSLYNTISPNSSQFYHPRHTTLQALQATQINNNIILPLTFIYSSQPTMPQPAQQPPSLPTSSIPRRPTRSPLLRQNNPLFTAFMLSQIDIDDTPQHTQDQHQYRSTVDINDTTENRIKALHFPPLSSMLLTLANTNRVACDIIPQYYNYLQKVTFYQALRFSQYTNKSRPYQYIIPHSLVPNQITPLPTKLPLLFSLKLPDHYMMSQIIYQSNQSGHTDCIRNNPCKMHLNSYLIQTHHRYQAVLSRLPRFYQPSLLSTYLDHNIGISVKSSLSDNINNLQRPNQKQEPQIITPLHEILHLLNVHTYSQSSHLQTPVFVSPENALGQQGINPPQLLQNPSTGVGSVESSKIQPFPLQYLSLLGSKTVFMPLVDCETLSILMKKYSTFFLQKLKSNQNSPTTTKSANNRSILDLYNTTMTSYTSFDFITQLFYYLSLFTPPKHPMTISVDNTQLSTIANPSSTKPQTVIPTSKVIIAPQKITIGDLTNVITQQHYLPPHVTLTSAYIAIYIMSLRTVPPVPRDTTLNAFPIHTPRMLLTHVINQYAKHLYPHKYPEHFKEMAELEQNEKKNASQSQLCLNSQKKPTNIQLINQGRVQSKHVIPPPPQTQTSFHPATFQQQTKLTISTTALSGKSSSKKAQSASPLLSKPNIHIMALEEKKFVALCEKYEKKLVETKYNTTHFKTLDPFKEYSARKRATLWPHDIYHWYTQRCGALFSEINDTLSKKGWKFDSSKPYVSNRLQDRMYTLFYDYHLETHPYCKLYVSNHPTLDDIPSIEGFTQIIRSNTKQCSSMLTLAQTKGTQNDKSIAMMAIDSAYLDPSKRRFLYAEVSLIAQIQREAVDIVFKLQQKK